MIAQLSKDYIKIKPSKSISRLVSYLFFEGRPITTKGQFINPFLFFFYKLITVFPKAKKIVMPIYIIGMGRSGTTVLGKILSLHPDLGFINEPKAMWYFANNEDDLIGSYTDKDAKYILNAENVQNNSSIKIHKLYAFYLRAIFTKRVLDKYPEMIFRVPFLKKIFPDAKFVFIYRNGWDASSSSDNWSKLNSKTMKNNEIHDWWGKNNRKWNLLINQVATKDIMLRNELNSLKAINNSNDKSAIEWLLTMNKGYELMNNETTNILSVKYEDLIENPEQELNKIFEYCLLNKDEMVVNYAKSILKPNTSKQPFKICEPFDKHFNQVMQKFNYTI